MRKPLAIIPTYMRELRDLEMLDACLRTLRGTARDTVDVLIVDDHSPNREMAYRAADELAPRWKADVHLKDENQGFSKTVNIGLQRALDEGRDAILVNADIEFRTPRWAEIMVNQPNLFHTGKAWVVGALLSYPPPSCLIQHAGTYFSLLTRNFDHLWRFSPENLPEALAYRCCPVTGALQFIRHECLATVGIYDDGFSMAFEDVDYCIRVLLAEQECVFHPGVRAFHHESVFRGRGDQHINDWTNESLIRLIDKWKHISFAGLVPSW